MAEAHPVELRERVVEAYESGMGSYPTVAQLLRVGEATAKRWVWQFRREGHVAPHKKGGGKRSEIALEEFESILAVVGDASAGEITAA